MSTRLTTLNAGEYFNYNGVDYEKLEKREHGNNCKNVQTGEVIKFPLMLYVDKIDKPSKKKRAPKIVENQIDSIDQVENTDNELKDLELDESKPLHPDF